VTVEQPISRYARFGPVARSISMILALFAGSLHIAMLWQDPLSREVLMEAGRGVVLLLLALGLMGSARLSLFLVILFCSTSLVNLGTATDGQHLTYGIEVSLLLFALIALLTPTLGD